MNDTELDNLIRNAMQPPYGLENRVAMAVLEDSRRVRRWRTWKIALATAACLALFAGLFTLTMPSPEPQRLAVILPAPPPLTESQQPSSVVKPSQPVRLAGNAQTPRNAASQSAVQKELPPVVRHIWLVQNLDEAKQLMRNLAEDNQIPLRLEGNAAIFQTTDQTAQSIADYLSSRKWELLSPDLPQPQQHSATKFIGKPVEYTAILTPLENK